MATAHRSARAVIGFSALFGSGASPSKAARSTPSASSPPDLVGGHQRQRREAVPIRLLAGECPRCLGAVGRHRASLTNDERDQLGWIVGRDGASTGEHVRVETGLCGRHQELRNGVEEVDRRRACAARGQHVLAQRIELYVELASAGDDARGLEQRELRVGPIHAPMIEPREPA